MEIGFIVIMTCLTAIVTASICVAYAHKDRRCKNCNLFRYSSRNKYNGRCKGSGLQRFPWEEACRAWKRKPINLLEDEI